MNEWMAREEEKWQECDGSYSYHELNARSLSTYIHKESGVEI